MRINLNSDADLVADIRERVKQNDGYCPCAIIHNTDTKCMCREFREQIAANIEGSCHCGLYIATNTTK